MRVDACLLGHCEVGEVAQYLVPAEDSVCVPQQSRRVADRHGEQQVPARRRDAPQLCECLAAAECVESVTIATEPDVLRHAEATHVVHGAVVIR